MVHSLDIYDCRSGFYWFAFIIRNPSLILTEITALCLLNLLLSPYFSLSCSFLLLLQLQIWASNKIHREERSSRGKWDVQSLITSSSDLYGPEKSASVEKLPRHVRIVWITLRLQRPGSASVNFGKDFSLLSLDEDENPFAQVDRRASFGGAVENEPLKREGLTSSQSSEQLSIRNWLDRAPQMSRFKVPIEAERLMDYDLVLEQYLPPASPSLAGFRLDSFSAIKPRVTHSPSSDSFT
ncbi:putative phosphoinositide phosphatase SAC9 [Citrus sinensis]|uniref:Phosphoinositide phosphatase SAC9 n=1 Tax=Citrus sinensis TaxID=2711 RepID=A0ACB8MBA9_CITSI|nr:putative phosphoinositide phosphatase SAC9 [Citrus sinensis]